MHRIRPTIIDNNYINTDPRVFLEIYGNQIKGSSGNKVNHRPRKATKGSFDLSFIIKYLNNYHSPYSDFSFSKYINQYKKKNPTAKKVIVPDWKYADERLKAQYYQLALAETKQLYVFSMDFTPALLNEIFRTDNMTDYFRRRFAVALKQSGINTQYWFSFDIKYEPTYQKLAKGMLDHLRTRGLLHIHGSVMLSDNQIPEFEEALHKLNIKTDSHFKQHSVNIEPPTNYNVSKLTYWATYSMRAHRTLNLLYVSKSISGKLITVDRKTVQQAKCLYSEFREKLKLANTVLH